ncbi:MAG: hypothetical protein EA426_06645 [Spirochaetaceae bacterium]|nr:MAG: hypothetical protein EA426_06645 [Spirochaetaceae bacterium]
MRSGKLLVFAVVLGLVFAGGVFADDAITIAPGSATLGFLAENGVNTAPLASPGATLDATSLNALRSIQLTNPDGLRDHVNADLSRAFSAGQTNVRIQIGPYVWALTAD